MDRTDRPYSATKYTLWNDFFTEDRRLFTVEKEREQLEMHHTSVRPLECVRACVRAFVLNTTQSPSDDDTCARATHQRCARFCYVCGETILSREKQLHTPVMTGIQPPRQRKRKRFWRLRSLVTFSRHALVFLVEVLGRERSRVMLDTVV
jgi:hypothetical protein